MNVLKYLVAFCRQKEKLTVLLFAVFLLHGCANPDEPVEQQPDLPFYNSADFDAEWISKNDVRYPHMHTIDSCILRSQGGDNNSSDSLKGKIYVANFFFTTCTAICPEMMANMARIQDSFTADKNIRLVSFSVMPWIDSVPVLKQYAVTHGIRSDKWYLLTGRRAKIYDLARHSFFAEKNATAANDSSELQHTETMLLIDKQARIRGIYNATQLPDIERACSDIHMLEKEG